ncbi:MAG: hypothetical protein ACK4FP_04235 [Azonexus sp.]
MKWFIDEISALLEQLKQWQTWLGIGLVGAFAGLAYLVATYAFRTDAILVFLRQAGSSCRELSNGTIIAMFCGMIFFGFTAVLTLGEFQRFVQFRQRAAHREARQALLWGISWAAIAVTIALGALVFFKQYCR